MKTIEASGIRKAFEMARAMTDPITLSSGLPDFDVAGPVKAAAVEAIERGRRPRSIASTAAALTGPATSKSGRPLERVIGSVIARAISNALRMPEASIVFIRSAIQASFTVGAPRRV